MRAFSKLITIIALLSNLIFTQSASGASDVLSVVSSTPYTGNIDAVGDIWRGNIPTKVVYPSGSFSMKLEFPIQALLPYSVVGNRSTGTEVEFEIWSSSGKKIAYDTVYSFDWNPVGPNTLVSMYVYEADANTTHTMIVRTMYELSTNGLLTRYLKSEKTFPIQFAIAKKPEVADLTAANSDRASAITYSFKSSANSTGYEVGIRYLIPGSTNKTTSASYYPFEFLKKVSNSPFTVSYEEIKAYLKPKNVDLSNSAIGIAVRGVNDYMVGEWGAWYYTETNEIVFADSRAKLAAEAAEAKAKADARAAEQAAVILAASCNYANTQVVSLNARIDAAQIKYPANSTFASIKSQAPVALDCSQSFSSGFASKIENLKNSTTSLESDVQNELARLLRIENLAKAPAKITITCKKGKLTKKVTALKPVCPSGYKKA
jgi:hypothetical protein